MSFATTMLAKYEALLEKAAGLKSIVIDGTTVSVTDLEEKWQYWKSQVQKETGKAATISRIRLDGF